jgi:tetratricopeptide (TPR) repeat protein
MKITINQAIAAHQEGKLEEAEQLYCSILESHPTNLIIRNNLGVLLYSLNRLDEAEESYKKAIELKPDYAEAHYNLGNTLQNLNRLDEAEASYKKVIELKPDYAEAHDNLGITLQNLNRLDEAEASYKKAIELKPDLVNVHNNLGLLLNQKILLSKIEQTKNSEVKNKIRLASNPFISNRKVEAELISQIYKINSKKLDDVDPGLLRYGNGKSSDYALFKNNFSTIKTLEKDLINILKEAVKSDIFIMESFFNIFQTGSGVVFHDHIINFDKVHGLIKQKFSLTYYLDVGDQNCSEPGILKLQDPDKEILPSEGMIVIFPASRKHSAVYNGGKDRVMIGINFYSLL